MAFRRAAKKALAKVQADRRRQIMVRLKELAADPTNRDADVKPIVGTDSFRLRVGDYRIRFSLDETEQTMTIELIRTRGDVYKR